MKFSKAVVELKDIRNTAKNYNLDEIISLDLIFLNKIAQIYYGII